MSEMTLWTIQKAPAWERAKEVGVLRADGRRVYPDERDAYRWMMEQMKERIPGYRGRYPVWAYPNRKPDLRRVQYYPGSHCVRLGFTADPSSVLVSHLGLWESVMSGQYCALTEAEDSAFRGEGVEWLYNIWQHGDKDPVRAKAIRESWGRVFDMAAAATDPEWCVSPDNLQATLEEVAVDKVFEVRPFVAR